MGRMPSPLVGVLDEAANVCRWKNLPDLYSHFGSRGIVLMTILQSWAQGQECWGDHGMQKLWGSANIRVYGGGAADAAGARAYVDAQWNEATVKQRYDWIFQYDATTVMI